MTDLKEKLQRLRHERDSRSKSQDIQDAWTKIEKSGGMTTKEKLEQLISLRRDKPSKPKPPAFQPQEKEALKFTENLYNLDARYGRIKIADGLKITGEILACLSRDDAFKDLDLSSALFIDLETTGLSGGTGVIPFNIGMGYFRDDKFRVGQYFLGEPAVEERMLHELAAFVEEMGFRSIVTYNGKVFDIPLLETRFILNRIPFRLSALPHLDFLFPARSLWKHKHENCRLSHLAHEVLLTGRDDDIPSAEIPWRYFQYLQTGNFDLIEPVLYHNAEDILSLLGVVIVGASIFMEEDLCESDAMDLFGAGKVLERLGDSDKAAVYFHRALDGDLTDEVGLSTRRRLAQQLKKKTEWEKSVKLWHEMAAAETPSSDLLYSLRELSMYFEHKDKNYQQALRFAEEGFVVSRGFSLSYENDFIRRRERLKLKLKAQVSKP